MDQFVYNPDLLKYLNRFAPIRDIYNLLIAYDRGNIITYLLGVALNTEEGLRYGPVDYFKCELCHEIEYETYRTIYPECPFCSKWSCYDCSVKCWSCNLNAACKNCVDQKKCITCGVYTCEKCRYCRCYAECSYCGVMDYIENITHCDKCVKNYCETCVCKCFTRCSECQANVHERNIIECFHCFVRLCSSCECDCFMECSVCDERRHEEDMHTCELCNAVLCAGCSDECGCL